MSLDMTELLQYSVSNNASDLHMSAGLPPMIRIDGDMRKIDLEALFSSGYTLYTEAGMNAFEQIKARMREALGNAEVAGSNPVLSRKGRLAHLVEHVETSAD